MTSETLEQTAADELLGIDHRPAIEQWMDRVLSWQQTPSRIQRGEEIPVPQTPWGIPDPDPEEDPALRLKTLNRLKARLDTPKEIRERWESIACLQSRASEELHDSIQREIDRLAREGGNDPMNPIIRSEGIAHAIFPGTIGAGYLAVIRCQLPADHLLCKAISPEHCPAIYCNGERCAVIVLGPPANSRGEPKAFYFLKAVKELTLTAACQ